MVSKEEKIPTNVIIFAPDKWGEVLKFRHFAAPTYNLPLYANAALIGIDGHFEKYTILMKIGQGLAPKLIEDYEELTKQGYSKATRSKELASIIDTLFCELYSAADCTRTVIGAIYGKFQNVPTNSTSRLFENAGKNMIDKRVPLEIRNALKEGQNDWFPRLKEIRDAINHFGIGSCSEHNGKISYYHDRLGKTIYNVLVTDDAFQEVSKYADNVNKFLGRVFHCLNLTLKDIETIQICGIFGSLVYQRSVSPIEARDFHSGKCKSFESFEKGLMPTCPSIKSCGAYPHVSEKRAADKKDI
ncbi:MAG: hypothetical protein FIB07_16955 [Candidatus Methanoperedens sp.]|nr:hypothetical protein [Candidatus Methanoperedens sp.]